MATEAPNTLRSRAKYRIVDMISEGPIVGLAEGLQSIYLNGTPLQASNGSLNFKTFQEATDLRILPRPVYPDSQPNQYGLFSTGTVSEATETVNTKVTKDSPEGSGSGDGSVIRTITDADLDELRVTLRIPALFVQDTTTGDSVGSSIDFKISVAADGGAFVPINTSSQWISWATAETQDGATGFSVKSRLWIDILNRLTAKSAVFQYAKKTGETWGSWVTFKTVAYPGQSPSSDKNSYWNSQNYFTTGYRDVEASVSNLEPGIYKIQIVATNVSPTITSKQQFVPAFSTITGKCVAPYDASYVVPLPKGGAPWTVKVERLTNDNIGSNYQDDLYWLSYTEVIFEKFAWTNLAGFELILNADDFDSIPERAYDVFGLMISIPSNYDPYNRTYSGIWDGTFQTNWTDNPAWILYDLIKNKRYGLGENIPESYLETLKWSLYSIAQYCDENITIADEISEPRYTCSCVINSQQEAYDLLNTIVSTFRGMLYPVGEGLMAVADRLTDPVINVGPANVIDGMFVYRGPARRTIHTAAYVTWNNPDDGYKLNTALYENQEGIARYGYKIDKINAVGACSKSLAIRLAKWKILTEVMAPDTVTYRASFDHLNVMPGDIINVSDPAYTSEELIGRILSITDNEDSTHTVELDRSVARIGGDESILQLTLPNQTILSIDVSVVSTTTGTEIIVPSAELTTMPVAGAMWLLSKETVRPRMWRVFNIEEAEKNIYEVSASLVDPEKWDEIEGTHNFEPADYTAFPSGELPAPTGLAHSEFLKQSGNSIVCCVNLSWTAPDDARAAFYRAEYRKGTEPWKSTEPVLCQNPSIDVFDIEPGTYDFRVQAQDGTGLMKSDWTYRTSQTLYGKQKAPENVTGFSGTVEKFGILLKWTPVSDIDIDFYEVRTGATWAGSAATAKKTKASELKIEDATTGTYQFWIAAKDTTGNYSATPVTTSVTVSAQSIPTVTATSVTSGIQIDIGGSVTRGFKAYEIQRRAYPAGTATTINNNVLTTKFNDSDIATLGYTTQWQYRVRALDQNGDASGWSNWSPEKTAKQVEGVDITANQIIAKDFRTALNAGCSTGSVVAGVLFNANGLEAWNSTTRTFHINAATGDVSMTGTITANNGLIGGWCIQPGCLCATNAKLYSGAANTARVEMGTGACSAGINSANAGTDISFWAGSTFANRASAPFNVTAAGALTATSGTIGGWTLGANALTRGACLTFGQYSTYGCGLWIASGSGILGVQVASGCIYDGSNWIAHSGIIARNASGVVLFRATSCATASGGDCGLLAGWNFNATQIFSTGCGLILCNTGAIQTGLFQAGNQGWRIDSVGNAEFNNICARGAIRTAVFIKDEISVVGGCTMIRPATILNLAWTTTTANAWIYTDNTQYSVNDIVRLKDGSGNDYWGRVYTCGVNGGNPYIGIVYCFGTTGWDATKGQAIVNYGSCLGCGGIMLNGQCPYIDLYTHAGLPWNALCSRVRIGNLKNWSANFACDTYGIAMGSALGQYMTYDSESGVLDIAGNINVKSTLPLVMPAGAVGEWVAKGSTTASIAVAGGVIDISGNGNHGQAFNGVTVVDSEVSKAFSFDGVDDYVSIANPLATIGFGDFAVSFWFKNPNYASNTVNYLATKDSFQTTGAGIWVATASNPPFVYADIGDGAAGSGTGINTTMPALSTTFQHLVLTRVAGVLQIYANGAFITSVARNVNINTTSALLIGKGYIYGLLNGQIAHLKTFNRALTPEEVKTLYLLGKDTESGTITAERIKTGVMSSLNWGTSAGSCFNMNNGTFTLGGSSAPKLSWNGTTLNVVGNITIAAGSSGIANFTDANIDNIADGSTYKRTTTNEKTGAGRAYSGLDSSNRLITAVIPGTAVTPSTAGLFIGSTNMGYHNGTEWRTYMGSNGNFYLGGTGVNAGMAWDALNNCLTVCGCITSCAGTIGGWVINTSGIIKFGATSARFLALYGGSTSCPNIIISGCNSGATFHTLGGCLFNGAWLNDRWGMVLRVGGNNLFQVHSCIDGTTCLCAQIAGWNFNAACLYSGNLILNSSGAISGCYNGDTTGWCIDAAGNAKFNNATVRGTVCASAGCIGCFSLSSGALVGVFAGDTTPTITVCSSTQCSWLMTQGLVARNGTEYRCSGVYGNGIQTIMYVGGSASNVLETIIYPSTITLTRIISGVDACSRIAFSSENSGASAGLAPAVVCVYGGTACAGYYTNGRMYASAFCVNSDRNMKTDFQSVNVLELLRQMPITKWRFKDSKDYHIGPMAQDFNSIFKLSHNWQTNLTVGGLDGIALKAVKEVDENVQRLERDNAAMRQKIAAIESSLAELKEAIAVH